MQNTQYLLALAQFNKFTARDLHNCLKKYNDIARMFNLSPAELAACGIRKNIALEFAAFRKKINTAPLEERLARENIRHISIFEKGYPALLKEIHDPPLIFFTSAHCRRANCWKLPLSVREKILITEFGPWKFWPMDCRRNNRSWSAAWR